LLSWQKHPDSIKKLGQAYLLGITQCNMCLQCLAMPAVPCNACMSHGPTNGAAAMNDACRLLTPMLPPLAFVPPHELPGIARIHVQAAAHFKTTRSLFVSEAFDDSLTPNSTSLNSIADKLPLSAEPMVQRLIDLQIFHLCHARQVVAQMRMHAQARRVCMEMCSAVDAASNPSSTDSCHHQWVVATKGG
jgi:hypothetical protein